MIQVEAVDFGGRTFKRTYSDDNFMLRKIGTDEIYSEAVDLPDAAFEYEETDEKIPEKHGGGELMRSTSPDFYPFSAAREVDCIMEGGNQL